MNSAYYSGNWSGSAPPQEQASHYQCSTGRYPAEYQPAMTQNYLTRPQPTYSRALPAVPPHGYNYPTHGSRHMSPDHGTLPSHAQFNKILDDYIMSLSTKKRDKALITRQRYSNILGVLQEPKCTTIETAQFRHWAKKMFELGTSQQGMPVVFHRDREQLRPVAVREELYEVLTDAHLRAQHGGRDKTAMMVKQYWSWVPKELIARFVRYCPACSARRGSPSKARMQAQQQQVAEEQKFKQESVDHAGHHHVEETTPPPAPYQKYEDNTQHQQYHGYPTPANSPTSTTQSQYGHLMMPNSGSHMQPEQQWDVGPYGSMSVQY